MKKPAVVTVGDRVRAARNAKALSQLDLAQAAGLRPEVVSRLERGASAASLASLHKLAPILGVTLDELLNGKPPAAPAPVASKPAAPAKPKPSKKKKG